LQCEIIKKYHFFVKKIKKIHRLLVGIIFKGVKLMQVPGISRFIQIIDKIETEEVRTLFKKQYPLKKPHENFKKQKDKSRP